MSEPTAESLRHQKILLNKIKGDWINSMMYQLQFALETEPKKVVSASDPEINEAVMDAMTGFSSIYGPGAPKFFLIQKDGIADEQEWNKMLDDRECVTLLDEADRIKTNVMHIIMDADRDKKTGTETIKNIEPVVAEEKKRLEEKLSEVETKIKLGERNETEVTSGRK